MRDAPGRPKNGAYPKDREDDWVSALIAGAAGALAFGASRMAGRFPELLERVYSTGFWPWISRPFSLLTGLLPFSLAELLAIAYVIWTLVAIGLTIAHLRSRRRRIGNALVGAARRIVLHAGVLVFLFYFLWGLNYARPPFEQRQGWPEWEGAETAELIQLSEQAVTLANELYLEIHGVPDSGEPTPVPGDVPALERSLDDGWARATRLLALQPAAGRRFGPVKRPLTSELIARFGITGIYSPFTAEANVLRGVPAMRLPHTMAHEKAHQRGITGEADASFLGFVASALAGDPLPRYAAAMYASSRLLASLASADPDEYSRIAGARLPGPKRDLADFNAWANRYNGVAQTVATAVNDRYLRANRVPGGVANYGRSVRLIIEFARRNEDRLMPAPESQ